MRLLLLLRLLLAGVLLALAGCAPQPTTVTVFAAASLTGPFEQMATAFEDENPGVDIVFSFGGSSSLAAQIDAGAPADVFASASTSLLRGEVFATNSLEIVVAEGAQVEGLADFADPAATIAVCAIEVPCGAAAAALFAERGITPSVDSYEPDVKAVLTKVALGEVDAGLVYVTDVRASTLRGIAVDAPPLDYPIASLTERGRDFVDFVLSPGGQGILRRAGFGAP